MTVDELCGTMSQKINYKFKLRGLKWHDLRLTLNEKVLADLMDDAFQNDLHVFQLVFEGQSIIQLILIPLKAAKWTIIPS